ncbi:aspartate aminotransferase family protein [Rhodospirillaceae bacterium SYSU D60014]|uniref:aspartate aminotransferase family protein n=1 Tax=Virgifigura deserti TaxID=2268457 RepID=UPI000E660C9C
MTHVFHRDPRATLPVAVRGEGVYILDEAGRRYLDASGGAAVSCLGHSHKKVVEAIQRQAATLPFAHTGFFTNRPMEELADVLIADAPAGLDKVYFVSGGSEATEAALKLARQYFLEQGQPKRRHFIARRQSYHGNTLGALAVGGNANRRRPYEPLLMAVSHIAPCYAYREQRPEETDEAYGQRAADALEAAILELGAESVAGFIAEPVVGATLGAVPAVPGYFKRIREICDRHGVLLILDEVMCGMGRTGTLYACTQDGVAPDLLTVAKGLGAGYQPVGALLASRRIFETVTSGSGQFRHGHTYMGHATACAAALAVQQVIREDDLLEAVNRQGRLLRALLDDRFADHPNVGDIRGRGLFLGLEIVADRATKAPFDPALQLHARIKTEAMRQGLMCYPMGGTADGIAGDHVLLAPPFIITDDEVREIVDRLAKAIDLALDTAPLSR